MSPLVRRALRNKWKASLPDITRLHLPETIALQLACRAPYMGIHTRDITPSSRTSSPVLFIPQSLTSRPPPTPIDDGPEARPPHPPRPPRATPRQTRQISHNAEFDIDWENIWHCGKRLVGPKKRHRHNRVVGTKTKESWICRHGANLDHNGLRYWVFRLCYEKKSCSALYASSGASHAARHLLCRHQIAEFGESGPSLRNPFTLASSSVSSSRPLSRQAGLGFQLTSHFSERAWKARFVDWIIL